mgnify:CR=1 FL=1|tara:strand:- start:9430 stop:10524 length:1095 start_codon:yes stop_codon:yes gene_type:complete
MNKITYIFSGGRINKVNSNAYAEEFFYGYKYLEHKNHNISIIEFSDIPRFLSKIEHKLSKVFSLPLYIFSTLTKKNLKSIKETDNLILVSESAGFASLLPLIFFKKKYNVKTHMFVMGLYSKKINFKIFKTFHNAWISLLVRYLDKLYFLGVEEYNIAKIKIKNHEKIVFKPFHIDCKFWNHKDITSFDKKQILFVGNDGNRDFNLLINIAKLMSDQKFTFVSSNDKLLDLELPNVTVLKGSWKDGVISDLDLKEIYQDSKLVILPLKNSTQPSGQSVALQSMAIGIPVLITKTDGFWDKENFNDNENILFESSSNPNFWVNKINFLLKNRELLNKISKNAYNLVNEKYNMEEFNKYLEKELGL